MERTEAPFMQTICYFYSVSKYSQVCFPNVKLKVVIWTHTYTFVWRMCVCVFHTPTLHWLEISLSVQG